MLLFQDLAVAASLMLQLLLGCQRWRKVVPMLVLAPLLGDPGGAALPVRNTPDADVYWLFVFACAFAMFAGGNCRVLWQGSTSAEATSCLARGS